MPQRALLLPAVALAAWTFVMWAWMYATRIPAIRRAQLKLDATIPRGEQMASLPPEVRWKADNYNHLFEQPTVFYPVVIVAALLPESGSTDVGLAASSRFQSPRSRWDSSRMRISGDTRAKAAARWVSACLRSRTLRCSAASSRLR